MQSPAAARVKTILLPLRDAFVQLLASDFLQAATIGERYSVPAGHEAPNLNSAVIRNILKALPERFRPEDLNYETIKASAQEIALAALKTIKEPRP